MEGPRINMFQGKVATKIEGDYVVSEGHKKNGQSQGCCYFLKKVSLVRLVLYYQEVTARTTILEFGGLCCCLFLPACVVQVSSVK